MYQNYIMDQVVLPLNLEVNIPETDLVRAVNGLVESIPDTVLYQLETKTGRPGYHPKMMLKVLLYGYTQNQCSGRKNRRSDDGQYPYDVAHHEVVSTVNTVNVNTAATETYSDEAVADRDSVDIFILSYGTKFGIANVKIKLLN